MLPRALARLQLFIAICVTAFVAVAHWTFYKNAGALWRDEANSVNVASAPSLFSDWLRYQFDSFPIGWFVVLRGWIRGFAEWPDFNLRLFGLVVGMLLLAMVWIVARSLGGKTPVVSLVLFAMSATTIRFGDSIRGYGIGMTLALATIGTYWRVCQKPSRARVWLAILCGFLSVHFLFYNAVVVLAVTVASAVLLVAQRRHGTALALFAAGAVDGASLLIYVAPMRAASTWNHVLRVPRGSDWFLARLREALNLSGSATSMVWLITLIVSAIVVIASFRSRVSWRDSMALWFCAITLAVALPAYFGFLYLLNYPMAPWYFLAAMALTAVCLDGILSLQKDGPSSRWAAAATLFMVVVVGISAQPVLFAVSQRQTTVDLAARYVAGEAGPGDFILVYEWVNGITFQRYYHGRAPWQTVPPISDHTVHRYDLVFAPETSGATEALNAAIRTRLQNGGRVWIVTSTHFPVAGQAALPEVHRFLNQVALPLARISERCDAPTIFWQFPTAFENVRVECRQARRR